MTDERQTDIRDFCAEAIAGPVLSSHRRRMAAIMQHYARVGITLAVVADKRHLGRSVATLKQYARDLSLKFPDYVPVKLRPPKPPKAKRGKAKVA